jgi:acetylornithine deacetylase/succinyl-diaminopimelate desuccinylase-like protein
LNPKLARNILSELVSLPSVHPDAFPGGTKPGEALAGAWVASYLAKLGAGVEARLLGPGRPNVVAVFDTVGKPRKTVVFAPHLDTVGVLGMTVPPFRLTARGGRLHGRGACDTKGPTAALLAALDHWSRSKERSRTDVRWVVASTAGEEQGSLGAEFICKRGFKADFAIALEPTNLRVVTGAKGVLRVRITLSGRAAHGSAPQRGINAVYGMMPLIEEIRGDFSRRLASGVHPLLGRATVNLGSIAGGGELNIVPATCTIGLDIRTHPALTGASVLRMLRATVSRLAPTATLEVVCNRPAFVTDRRGEWARSVRGSARGWATADWFCDANVFSSFGIPAVAFGPGRIEQAHTRDEFILERDLNMGAQAFLGILLASPPASPAAPASPRR